MSLRVRLTIAALVLCAASSAFAHCEVPCGIYDDELRVKKIEEDILLLEKASSEIQALSKEPGKNMNQLVRWVRNKEAHADDIREIAVQYFLAQRIKPESPKYAEQMALLHGMILQAVKAKQTTDPAAAAQLRELVQKFRASYFESAKQSHPEKGEKPTS